MIDRKSSTLIILKAALLCLFALVLGSSSALCQEGSDLRQERLAKSLTSGDDEQKLVAVIDLGSLLSLDTTATSQTITLLGNYLQSDSSAIHRSLAARAMELSRDERFIPFLVSNLITERDVAVCKAIIYALAPHRSPQVVATLLPMLIDKRQDVRAAAAYALAEIADPASTNALIDLLKKRGKDEDAFARTQAVRGLGKIGKREAIDPLLEALKRDKSSEVQRESVRSLGLIANSQDLNVVETLKQVKLQSDPYLATLAASVVQKLSP